MVDKALVARQTLASSLGLDGEHVEKRYGVLRPAGGNEWLAKLADDIAWATEHDIHGTPLVLLNGRPVAPFGPLLYALVLTSGDASHPVFAGLPEPRPPQPHTHAH